MYSFVKLLRNIFYSNPVRNISSMTGGLKGANMNRDYYVWTDLEMTGLDENVHKIVEVACLLTDSQLNVLHEGIYLVVHQPKDVWDKADEWARTHHYSSGLLQDSVNSKISVEEADKLMTEYVKKHTNYDQKNGKYYLAGNTVYMDKRFLEKYMVNINSMLHYRLVDVSTIKILCSHWYPEAFQGLPQKSYKHRALSDITESINELKIYKDKFFKSQEEN